MNLKERIKELVPPNSRVRSILVSLYHLSKYRLWKPSKLNSIPISAILDNYSKLIKNIKFVQIGSNDGVEEDPIRQFILRDRWQGVLVEPLPATFQKLLKNYDSYQYKQDLSFENVAISDASERKIFYFIDARKANISESSANKFSSFDKAIPLKLKWEHPDIENSICEIDIEAVNINTLLDKYNLKKGLNLLHIDTEGHDHVILKQIDFSITRPGIVLFENLHMKLRDYKVCVKALRRNNYILFEQNLDTIAIQYEYKDRIMVSTFAG